MPTPPPPTPPRNRRSRLWLRIFRDAPGMAYGSTLIPWHIVPTSQILCQHDR